jgi:hypothetical protein
MKSTQLGIRIDVQRDEEFSANATKLGHSKSSLIIALIDAVNRHMEETGSLTFPVTFQGTDPKKELASNARAAARAAKAGANSKAQKKTA